MRHSLYALVAGLILLPQLASALTLDEAKAQGLVGERPTGYLGAVKSGSEVNGLVDSINSQRRAEYERIAKQNGQSREAVEAVAAQKAYELTRPGYYLQGADGSWKTK